MKLSIVTTLYNSGRTIEEFVRRACAAASQVASSYEVVIVDDGSPDNSLDLALKMAERNPHLKIVELSRNFGHHKALMTGLMHAAGELVFLIDSDLEESPELLESFWDRMKVGDVDVVYGYQTKRKGRPIERLAGYFAYKLFDALLSHRVPLNAATVRLMKKEFVDALLLHRERQTVIGGLWVLTGYKQFGVQITKVTSPRTNYSIWRRWAALIDSITAFSETPLVAIFYLGIGISFLSVCMGIWLVARKIFFGDTLSGWVSVMLSVWFLGGILIFCVGIIGIYISKIFIETKNRPYTIVRKVHSQRAPSALVIQGGDHERK